MSKKEKAGIGVGIVSLLGTLASMLDPTFLLATADIWFPMTSYTLRYGPNIPGLPEEAILTVVTSMFVTVLGYRLYARANRESHET
ncbi:hypothetical protein ACFQL9_13045 [Halobaculum lipolyticum]|uniref:Lycopene cyclase domain-containing protein n=1 Tax=Halobaculum lipolyticum TaxID=3032001 RepID=A0ABD5WC80_9EURY